MASLFFIEVLKVDKPANAKIVAIIQNRITMVDSGHPFFKMMVNWGHQKKILLWVNL